MRSLIALSLVACVSLVLVACGGDETTSTPAGEATATDATITDPSTTVSSTTLTVDPPPTSTSTDQTGLPEEHCEGAESPPNITEVVSYGADCGAVEDAMAEIQSVSTEFRIGDFQCARVSGSELSGTWECRGEASYFTFQFAD